MIILVGFSFTGQNWNHSKPVREIFLSCLSWLTGTCLSESGSSLKRKVLDKPRTCVGGRTEEGT